MVETLELVTPEANPNGPPRAYEIGPENRLVITVEGVSQEASTDDLLIDVINRGGIQLPQVCYHPQLGPIQTCDTCIVEIDGKLVRACATKISQGLTVSTNSSAASEAQREAFDRILSNHLLYCTVCDNSNGDCTVHNTTSYLELSIRTFPFARSHMR